MNIVLLGAPGAGKGTLAEALENRFSIPSISTGNIIRETLKTESELSRKAKTFVESGKLLPNNIVIDIMKEKINSKACKKGFILDGFPRTITQAEALDNMNVHIDVAINIDVPDDVIIERMSGRVVCEDCGSSYHLINKPPNDKGICDLCKGRLIKRKDDDPEIIKNRLDIYHKETEPLIDYYKKQDKLSSINGRNGINKLISSAAFVLEFLI
ncbi:MAG: adenylate kinase [Oscillospiraceae bacterium]|jgi:adenylate kinase|nr:adenylate kinase [Oscillospiraceae bacterium]